MAEKILIITNRIWKVNKDIHGEFLQRMIKINPNVYFYGPNLMGITNNIIKYIDAKYIIELSKQFDKIVFYRGGHKTLDFIDISIFKSIIRPKILIDVDFFYLRERKEDIHILFDLHILRNPVDLKYTKNTNQECLPFSVNTSIYYPTKIKKENICYLGSDYSHPIYKIRKKGCELLNPDIYFKLSNKEQAIIYSKHIAALTCGTTLRSIGAKHFEIGAMGIVLFTNNTNELMGKYFPNDTYVSYKDDCSNIINLWEEVKSNKEYFLEQAKILAFHIQKYHSHEVRIKELYNMIIKLKK